MLGMTLPGAGLSYMLKLDACRVLVSIALSLSVAVFVLLLARVAGFGTQGFGYTLLCAYLLIGVGVAMVWRRVRGRRSSEVRLETVHAVPALVLISIASYMLWAGPYAEVPADAWWHIGRINDRLSQAALGGIGRVDDVGDLFNKSAGYWYTIAAFFLHVSGATLDNGLPLLALANTLLFCTAVYAFALFVFRDVVDDRWLRHWIAAAGVFFFVAHFGLSVFSYVRYYVYAPTILNYVVYLAAVACVLNFIRGDEGAWRFPVIAMVLVVAAAMVHKQEAGFIVAMSGAMILVESLRLYGARAGYTGSGLMAGRGARERRVFVLLAICTTVYIAAHAWAYLTVARHNPLAHGLMADIRNYLPFLQNLYILKPTHQFYQAVTIWGVLVYILFLVRARQFLPSPYLVAGMAMPLLTVFNPVFTDLFLRFSWPEVLWRMLYMLPLPLVGGYFLVKGVEGGIRASNALVRAGSLAMAAALVVLLVPIQTTYFVSPHSKIYTLAPVSEANDHRIWADLLEFLGGEKGTIVVTDRVTGYVINGLTPHRYFGYKFYGNRAYPVDRDTYEVRDFSNKDGWMVVVNERDGASSAVGRHGGHWPAGIMRVSEYYSRTFLEFVADHPEMFDRIWARDRIAAYRILRSTE